MLRVELCCEKELGDRISAFIGMKEWNEHKPKEIVRKYLEFVYETGYSEDGGQRTVNRQESLEKEVLIRRLSKRNAGGNTRSAGWIASDIDADILLIQGLSVEKTLFRRPQ